MGRPIMRWKDRSCGGDAFRDSLRIPCVPILPKQWIAPAFCDFRCSVIHLPPCIYSIQTNTPRCLQQGHVSQKMPHPVALWISVLPIHRASALKFSTLCPSFWHPSIRRHHWRLSYSAAKLLLSRNRHTCSQPTAMPTCLPTSLTFAGFSGAAMRQPLRHMECRLSILQRSGLVS